MSDMIGGRVSFGSSTDASEQVRARRLVDSYRSLASQVAQSSQAHACNCIGPQAGEMKCPCALRAESAQGRRMISDGVVIDGVEYDLVLRAN